jgi:hypothetical protein
MNERKRAQGTIAEFALSQGIPVVKRNGEDCIRVSDATFEYLSRLHEPILCPLFCSCAQRPYPHDLSVHRKLYEAPAICWPWSLRFVLEVNP